MGSYVGEEGFKNKLKEIHPNLKLVGEYKESNSKVLVEDKYGVYSVYANSLISGKYPMTSSSINKTECFKNKLKEVNSEVEIIGNYVKNNVKILVKYKEELFEIKPNDLLMGVKPSIQSSSNKTEAFLRLIPNTYKNRYDCSNIIYKNNNTKVKVICPTHGEFYQKPEYILKGHICKNCSAVEAGGDGTYNVTIANRKKDKWSNRKAILYIVNLFSEKENFYKIGITTTNTKHRMSCIKDYNFSTLKEISTNLYKAVMLENKLLRMHKDFRYYPNNFFGGHTECFNKIIV